MTREKWNNGEWTEARFNSFIKSALRAASRRWPPKFRTLENAFVGKLVNKATGRLGKHYKCAGCSDAFPSSQVQVDHINPIVDPKAGFTTWDDVINNMFCEQDNLQVLCIPCHKIKTAQERMEKKEDVHQARSGTAGRKRKLPRGS